MTPRDPLYKIIEALKDMAGAPREDWLALCHKIEEAGQVFPSQGGAAATLLAGAAKAIVRQAHHCVGESETDLRGICGALAVVLQNEVNAHHGGDARPHYARD